MPAPEGTNFAAGNDGGGAPDGNQNAQTHGLFASHDGYFANLDADKPDEFDLLRLKHTLSE